VNLFTFNFSLVAPFFVFFVSQYQKPNVLVHHQEQVDYNVNHRSCACQITLVKLKILVWLEISEANKVVKHHHYHDLVKKFHVIRSGNLEWS
jgi:hypothetical protein